MNAPRARLPLPVSTALAAGLILGWGALLLQPGGVRVANHSAQVLRAVTVCAGEGTCVVRARLLPHEAWAVPLRRGDTCVAVTFAGHSQSAACTAVPGAAGMRFVVQAGGQVQTE